MKKIKTALISVFYKDGLEDIVRLLDKLSIKIYTTGGTQKFIEDLGVSCIAVESLTGYPSILGGRVKTLHPAVFGGILGKRNDPQHVSEMQQFNIPEIDLVIVDLYPFVETVESHKGGSAADEAAIIEKIDIGGPSMIRAAAKNFNDVLVIASKADYQSLITTLKEQNGETTLEQRRMFAVKAFDVCSGYDISISDYFNKTSFSDPFSKQKSLLRYGENPHQQGIYSGDLQEIFEQLNGKELSYNNLVDVDAALHLMNDLKENRSVFAIIKHTNVCGAAIRDNVFDSWKAALEGDPESAFGGILITNNTVDKKTAESINEIFFEVLIAPSFDEDALTILRSKKNRILLKQKGYPSSTTPSRSLLNGILSQDEDKGNFTEWKEAGGRVSSEAEKFDLTFANVLSKHLKSNAIALVKNGQLIGKGCGQTSRIDALRQAINKAGQFKFDLKDSVLASDAFFPFDDCVKIAHESGVNAFIQPGGSIRDKDSIDYCIQNGLVMVITGMRHFKH